MTIEEVLDDMLGLPVGAEHRDPANTSGGSLDTSLPHTAVTPTSFDGYSIFTENTVLMDKCVRHPELAEDLLKVCLYAQCLNDNRTSQSATKSRLNYEVEEL